jgi:hypothetical protein
LGPALHMNPIDFYSQLIAKVRHNLEAIDLHIQLDHQYNHNKIQSTKIVKILIHRDTIRGTCQLNNQVKANGHLWFTWNHKWTAAVSCGYKEN